MQTHTDHLYQELRRMAGSFMRRERRGHTLQPTALANEAFLYVGTESRDWDSTGHFFGAAANAMRQILIQHARSRRAQKRGGEALRVTFDAVDVPYESSSREAASMKDALAALRDSDASLAEMVEMRYFGGYTLEEIAGRSGRSLAAVKRDWTYARAWLFEHLTRSAPRR